jgi:hypothetical protein
VGATTLLAIVGLIVAILLGAVFALSTARRPTFAEVSLVLVAVALLTGKSFPVQASLWLVPLVALCGLRWRDHLIWASAEALHFVAVWLYVAGLSTPDRGMPAGWYAVFLVVRLVGVGYLVLRVWQNASQRPEAVWPDEELDEELGEVPGPLPAGGLGDEGLDQGLDPGLDQGLDQLLEQEPDEMAGDFAGAPDRVVVRIG